MSNEEKENVCHLVVNNYSDTRKSIDREQEAIIIKRKNSVYSSETYKKYGNAKLIKSEISKAVLSSADSDTTFNEKKNYHIAVCQDGKFVVTFDTENLQIKILKNISNSPYKDNNQSTSDKINETIIQFKIDGNDEGKEITSNNDEKSGWSIDISNVYTNDTKDCKRKCFIFVAVSRIIDEDMKNMKNTIKKAKERNRTIVIYRIELINGNYVSDRDTKNTIIYKIHGISGICRFVHESRNNEVLSLESDILRFIVLNFDGMRSFDYKDNFKLYKKFNYPEHIKRKLEALDSSEISDCMNLLFSCIYDKYFLIEHYKDNVHLLEVYDLAKMRLETITKRVENSQDKLIRNYNRKNFSISKNKQLLCFTRGFHSINLYFMENGLEAINKKFDGIEEIYLVEFFENDRKLIVIGIGVSEDEENLKLIIWDMYNVVETETIELDDFLTTKNIYTRLTRTSGNLLQIDDKGDVTSIVKRVDRLLKQKQSKMIGKIVSPLPPSPDLSYFKGVKPMVVEIEPWVLGNYKDYKSNSYCLYQNKNGSEIETLQLIVGRSTIQVWHQINSDDKNKSKDELPNKGKPFLEYIWTNGIPVNQEREKTRLRIEKFEYRSNVDFNLTDFYIIDKVNAIRHACKALEFINKRKKFLVNYTKEHLYEDMVVYINHIIWRFIKYKPDDFRLLDVRRNVMKNLILGREIKDTVIVAYLLEYYSRHATDSGGWMSTMSKALPLLFKYNYDDYARKIFRKECFANQDYFSVQDSYNIIPIKYQAKRNHNIKFRAFRIDNLQSDECSIWYNRIGKLVKPFKRLYNFLEDFDNYLEKSPLALRVVPLPGFTRDIISHKNIEQNSRIKIALNVFLFLFIPRWYKIGRNEKEKLSPFSRMVRYENNDDIYDNLATEAVIDFRWPQARNFFFFLFLRFLVFAFCYIFVSWEYLSHEVISGKFRNFLVALIFIFYYLAAYLLITEFIELYFHGHRKYFNDIFNYFDVFSILLPVIVMSIMLRSFRFSDGFESVETVDSELIAYILLYDPKNIKTKDSTFNGTATNLVNGQELNVSMKANFDPTDWNDNPFSFFPTAIVATYYWLNGNFVQRDTFDFWAVEVFTFIGSILLITILQNMLIAFMGGVYEEAATKGRQALLRFRANQIANYEALHHYYFSSHDYDPKYIYYIRRSEHFETWYEDRKNDGPIFKDVEKKSTFAEFVFKDKFKMMKKSLNDNIENLIKNLEDRKNDNANDNIDIDKKIEQLKAIKN
ncbi:13580_t:CDS:10 [Rhizophagus irregularis]|nr:13580_t:CDS:10 [Rhizophagus irregularis]